MIGNVIQGQFLTLADYPTAAALSFVLMALILIVVVVYIRGAGSRALIGDDEAGWRPHTASAAAPASGDLAARAPASAAPSRSTCGWRPRTC